MPSSPRREANVRAYVRLFVRYTPGGTTWLARIREYEKETETEIEKKENKTAYVGRSRLRPPTIRADERTLTSIFGFYRSDPTRCSTKTRGVGTPVKESLRSREVHSRHSPGAFVRGLRPCDKAGDGVRVHSYASFDSFVCFFPSFVLSHLISLFYRAEPRISPARRADFRTCSGNGFVRFARGNYCELFGIIAAKNSGRFVIAVYREPMCSYRFLSSRHNFYLVSSEDALSLFLSFSRIHTRESHAPPPANFYLIYPCFLFLFFFPPPPLYYHILIFPRMLDT